jgi:aspartyl/asparaginyl-tRNA synthetase
MFFRYFGKNKLKKIDQDNPDYQEIVDTLIPQSSSYVKYDEDEDPEKRKYAYDTMKLRVIYGTNQDTGAKKFYLDMTKFNPETGEDVKITEDKYEEMFGGEMRGCVARFQYQP